MTDWRTKVTSPDQAIGIIKPGDTVYAGILTSGPRLLSNALVGRAGQLPGVTVCVSGTPCNWDQPEVRKNFRFRGAFLGMSERALFRDGIYDYLPVLGFREGRMPTGFDSFDVAMISVTPPDSDGWCTYGHSVWYSPTVVPLSRHVIAEIVPSFPRTHGDRIHVSQIHSFVESTGPAAMPSIPAPSPDAVKNLDTICRAVAELVPDGATLQLGVGDIPPKLVRYLGDKKDLGMHSELVPSGVVALVESGVMTGARKEIEPGKVVGTQLGILTADEVRSIDSNPRYMMREAGWVNDLRVLLAFETFTAVNGALLVDLTGNVAAEGLGPAVYSGPGGQPGFAYTASVTSQRSIIALPSTFKKDDATPPRSRIVAAFPPATTITTHRACVDYVVTEFGVAKLSGRGLRDRVRELINVAHPDFRADLMKQAAGL
jgi:4-hydroxybutyrate CoA-transferase